MNFVKYLLSNMLLTLGLLILFVLIVVGINAIDEKAAVYSAYILTPLFIITLLISMVKGAFKTTD
jgi:hypothetical protein